MFDSFFHAAWRQFLRAPITGVVNVVGLALGIACFLGAWGTSSFWSHSDAHFTHAERVVVITQEFIASNSGSGPRASTATPALRYLREEATELEAVARIGFSYTATVSAKDRASNLLAAAADPEILQVFDFDFLYGDSESALDVPGSVVLTSSAAARLFGTSNPVGESLMFDGDDPGMVTGVLREIPQPSHLGDHDDALRQFDILYTWEAPPEDATEWWLGVNGSTYGLLPRENMEASFSSLRDRLSTFAQRRIPPEQLELAQVQFDAIGLDQLQVRSLDAMLFRDQAGTFSVLTVLFGLGLLVLLLSCINYANLATAQATGRAKEVGMRKVLGASFLHIAVQHWMEALAFAVVALILALGTLFFLSPVIQFMAGIDILGGLMLQEKLPVVLGAVLLLVSIMSSAYPSFVLSRVRPVQALRSGQSRSGAKRMTQLLVCLQFVAASTLLIVLLVVHKQNRFMKQSGLATDSDPVVILTDTGSRQLDFSTLRATLSEEPSVLSMGGMNYIPWSGYDNFFEMSRSQEASSHSVTGFISYVSHGFFEVFDATLLAGRWYQPDRDIPDSDTANDIPMVIDLAYATLLGFDSAHSAVDQIVYLGRQTAAVSENDPTYRIIGVVETLPLVFGAGDVQGNIYMQFEEGSGFPLFRLDRSRLQEGISKIEAAAKAIDPDIALQLRFTEAEFERNFRTFEGINSAFIGLSLVAFLIAGMGLSAMAMYVAGRRRHEIGVRKTLGASVTQIMMLLLRDFSIPVVVANIIAWPIAFFATRIYLDSFMRRIDLTPMPWFIGFAMTLLIAWLAVAGQAWNAAKVQPSEVLRDE